MSGLRRKDLFGEVGIEVFDEARYFPCDGWEGGEPKQSLAERYLDQRLGFHAHLWLTGLDSDPKPRKLCAVFEPKSRRGHLPLDNDVRVDRLPAKDEGNVGLRRTDESGVDEFVAVEVGVAAEQLYGTGRSVRASVVRLQPLDDCGMVGAHPVDPFDAHGFELALLVENGEPGDPRDGLVVEQDELRDEIVERGAQVVEQVAEHRSKLDWWGLPDLEVEDAPPLSLLLSDDLVRLTIDKRLGRYVERVEVVPCAPELGERIAERR